METAMTKPQGENKACPTGCRIIFLVQFAKQKGKNCFAVYQSKRSELGGEHRAYWHNLVRRADEEERGNLDSSLYFIQPGISHDVLCM